MRTRFLILISTSNPRIRGISHPSSGIAGSPKSRIATTRKTKSLALIALFILVVATAAVAAPDPIAVLGESQTAFLSAKGQPRAILVRIGDIDYPRLSTTIESLHDAWNTCDDIYTLSSASLRSLILGVSGNPVRRLGVAFVYPEADYIVDDSGTVAWIEFRDAAQAMALMAVGPGDSVAAIQTAFGKPDLWEDGALLYARRDVGGREVSLSFRIRQDTVESVALWLSR